MATTARDAVEATSGARVLYATEGLAASTIDVAHVDVEMSLKGRNVELDKFAELIASPPGKEKSKAGRVRKALEEAAERFVREVLAKEFAGLIDQYRLMLRESLARGDDEALKAALNRVRLQERILAETPMAEQAEACELLGLSNANPSATMKRKAERGELLRFSVDGRPAYPLLQFDTENRRSFPALASLIAMKPADWSDFRLLHWLIRPHCDFDGSPADALAKRPEDVIAAFGREVEPVRHG